MPIIKWLQYADHEMAPMCRSVTHGNAKQSLAEATVHPGQETRILCCCSPAYSHDDTVLLTGEMGGFTA